MKHACVKLGDRTICANRHEPGDDGTEFGALVVKCANHLGKPLETTRQLIAQIWFQSDLPATPYKRSRSISDWINGATAILRDIAGGVVGSAAAEKLKLRVNQAEAERRASICMGCPWRAETSTCKACGAYAYARAAVGDASLPYHPQVETGGCSVCDCSLAVMVWAVPEAFRTEDKQDERRPNNCWVKHITL